MDTYPLIATITSVIVYIHHSQSHILFATNEDFHGFCVFQGFYSQLSSKLLAIKEYTCMCMIATTNLKGAIVLGWMCVTTFNVVWIGVLIKTPGWRLEV